MQHFVSPDRSGQADGIRRNRREWLVGMGGMVASVVAGCRPSTEGSDGAARDPGGGAQKVTLMLNWFPEVEHGGFFAAKVEGIAAQLGLQLAIRSGGPAAPVAQELVTGRVDFAVANADDVLLYQQQGAPVVAVLAAMQQSPRCILVHRDSGITSLEQLRGLTLQAGAGRPYLLFLQARGLLDGVQVVPYSGVPRFCADKKSAMQGYLFSEPFLAEQLGCPAHALLVADLGFNPYASCLVTTRRAIAERADLVARMVQACRDGWLRYLESPQETNLEILRANQHGMTQEALEYGSRAIQPLCLPTGMRREEFGQMTRSRWQQLFDQFLELGLIDAQRFRVDDVYTSRFIDAAVAPGVPQ
ncbi:MAG: ABC transporter permease [Pirellulaceae bacterium]|nr:MAG: ABC transporter permease [Pirellulaceae bacterium]